MCSEVFISPPPVCPFHAEPLQFQGSSCCGKTNFWTDSTKPAPWLWELFCLDRAGIAGFLSRRNAYRSHRAGTTQVSRPIGSYLPIRARGDNSFRHANAMKGRVDESGRAILEITIAAKSPFYWSEHSCIASLFSSRATRDWLTPSNCPWLLMGRTHWDYSPHNSSTWRPHVNLDKLIRIMLLRCDKLGQWYATLAIAINRCARRW